MKKWRKNNNKDESKEYFKILFDKNQFIEINKKLNFIKNINFIDKKPYLLKIKEIKKKTKLEESVRTAYGKINNCNILIVCIDFNFIGGTIGLTAGEKISRAIKYSIIKKVPLIIISKSGGMRITESGFALIQMAKISSKLSELLKLKIPYISLMTNPTAGGSTASFGMLGDFNISEPNTLICFTGPKIIEEFTKKKIKKKYQNSEKLIKRGFLDFIVNKKKTKNIITKLLKMLKT